MNSLYGLFIFSAFCLIGRSIEYFYSLWIPGDIVGLGMLLLYLCYAKKTPDELTQTSQFLLSNIGILFVPAGVGLINYLWFLNQYWKIIVFASILTTIISLISCLLIFNCLERYESP